MTTIFISDSEHVSVQSLQQDSLAKRALEVISLSWTVGSSDIFSELDAIKASHSTIIASFHGAVAAAHWVAQHPRLVRRLILIQPSLNLGLPNQPLPPPHFVPTQVHWSTSAASIENTSLISTICGKLFYDYTLQFSAEPPDFATTLSLLSLP